MPRNWRAKWSSEQDSQAGQQTQAGQSGQTGQTGQQRRQQAGRGGQPGQRSAASRECTGPRRRTGDASRAAASAAAGRVRGDAERGQRPATAGRGRGRRARSPCRCRGFAISRRSLQQGAPDEQRRALGDLQLEARQLADAERQIGRELESGRGDGDAERRLAGEQERLADRVRRLEDGLERQAGEPGGRRRTSASRRARAGTESAAAQRAKRHGRSNASVSPTGWSRQPPACATARPTSTAASRADRDDIARALDRVAERLASTTAGGDDDSRRMTDQLARAQELRERIETAHARNGDGSIERRRDKGRQGRQVRPVGAGQAGREGQAGQAGQAHAGRSGSGQAGQVGRDGTVRAARAGWPARADWAAGAAVKAAAGGSEFAELRRSTRGNWSRRDSCSSSCSERTCASGKAGPASPSRGRGWCCRRRAPKRSSRTSPAGPSSPRQATQALDRASSSLSQALEATPVARPARLGRRRPARPRATSSRSTAISKPWPTGR